MEKEKTKNKEEINDESARCKKCKSTLTYIRIGKQERVCRSCGHVEDLNKQKGGK